jgi:hypoxanthine phosphoribosyltransferase
MMQQVSPTSGQPPVIIGDDVFRVFLSEEQLKERLVELGRQIEIDYAGKKPIFIGVLNGGFIFLADLIREVQTIDLEVDFLKLSSYGDEKISSGKVQLLKSINADLKGRDIVIVEDIVDSGLSMTFMRKMMLKLQPASLRFATMLFKEGTSQLDFTIDYIGFKIPKHFVIGYGLDYKQIKRNLKEIYMLTDK